MMNKNTIKYIRGGDKISTWISSHDFGYYLKDTVI